MRSLRAALLHPAFHLSLITLLLAGVMLRCEVIPQDNHFDYQNFIETLAGGRLDLSIPGFHGSSFLAMPVWWLTHSPLTHTWTQLLFALLVPLAGYWAAVELTKNRLHAVLFAYALALMPFLTFIALRGFNFPSYTVFLFVTLALRARGSAWTWLALSTAILIKPFAIALLPLFWFWEPHPGKGRFQSGRTQYMLAALLPLLYVAIQYSQIGRIMVGTHPDIDQGNVFLWERLPLNILHGIQMLFSIHNFYFVDPARTGLGNLVHSSPVLLLLGCLVFLYPRPDWQDTRLTRCLGLSALCAFLLSALLDHMDHFYMETAVLLLSLGGVTVLARRRLMIPLVLVTLHFQFFYLYLNWKGSYFTDLSLFAVPIVIDVIALLYWAWLIAPGVQWKKIASWFFTREPDPVPAA